MKPTTERTPCSAPLKPRSQVRLAILLILLAAWAAAGAAVHYVDANSANPVPPYRSWATAARTIQNAVDVAALGDEVVVTNGVYETGQRGVVDGWTNRVAITNALTVRSVNGPSVTIIRGYQVPGTTNGDGAVRCVYLGDSAVLAGFTLTAGATGEPPLPEGNQDGGGVWCASTSAIVTNCVITGNSCFWNGGGVYSGTLYNCVIAGNQAYQGGGVCGSMLNNCEVSGNLAANVGGGVNAATLNNCTMTRNSAKGSGGAASSSLNNCLVYWNQAGNSPNCDMSCTLAYCCTTPLPPGKGNMDVDPQMASFSHLSAGSPCRGAGNPDYAFGTDLDDEPWANPPSIGCDEFLAGTAGPLSVSIEAAYTDLSAGFAVPFLANINGPATTSAWDFGDGMVISNRPYVMHAWAAAGDYTVVLRAYNASYAAGVSTTVFVHVQAQPVHYVSLSTWMPTPPYTSWETAANNIQDAVDVASVTGALVLVGDGIYDWGERVVDGTLANRVVVAKPVVVRSLNGASATMIQGYQVPGSTNGPGAVRSVYLANGAVLDGFTVTNGATLMFSTNYEELCGGGVYCPYPSGEVVVTNCVLAGNAAGNGGGAYRAPLTCCTVSGNWADYSGGGAAGCVLKDCTLVTNFASHSGGGVVDSTVYGCTFSSNRAYIRYWNGDVEGAGGGAHSSMLYDCTLTGNSANVAGGACSCTLAGCTLTDNSAAGDAGANGSTLNNCTLSGNTATGGGGGAGSCTLNNCALTGNSAGTEGGGVNTCTLNNCTVTGNSAGHEGGGAYHSRLRNCIVYYNQAPLSPNCPPNETDDRYSLAYCCTTPLPLMGPGNFETEPQLASPSRLSPGSPCRGAGNANFTTGTDIDGEPWAHPPSIGCDEFYGGAVTGSLSVRIQAASTSFATGFTAGFVADITGQVSASFWGFGDGTVVSNSPYVSHAWTNTGDYSVALRAYNQTYPGGVSATVLVHVVSQPIHYVSLTSAAPQPPYDSWATAARNIQDAVDAASVPGALVLVNNGVYQTGGRVGEDGTTNRLMVTRPVVVQSVSGSALTTIRGYQVPGSLNGYAAVRCVSMTNGAVLKGFKLTYGATWGDAPGGVYCPSGGGQVFDCVLADNAGFSGGGAYGVTLSNCTFSANTAGNGGGAYACTLVNCTLTGNSSTLYGGGGTWGCTLSNCTLSGNSAWSGSGGASSSTLKNCILTGNSGSAGGAVERSRLSDCALTGNWSGDCGGAIDQSTLINCTLKGNSATNSGGAAWRSTLTGCVITANTAGQQGGGDYQSTLNNCALTANSAGTAGGGAYESTLNNCTVTGNSAGTAGGGAYGSRLNNCIVYYNHAVGSPNIESCALNYSCTTPLPWGPGNLEAEPQLVSASRLGAASPCRGAGSAAYATGTDIDGEPWGNPPSMGCDEPYAGSVTGALSVRIQAAYTTMTPGFIGGFVADITGAAAVSAWDFGDGTVISNWPYASHSWSAAGNYPLVLRAYNDSNPGGVSATVMVHVVTQPVHYVSLTSPSPAAPYSSWATAARTIQAAVDAASVPGALVVVSNGVYATGQRAVEGTMLNRVVVNKPLAVRSLNGPGVTTISGYQVPGSTNADGAVRCAYLSGGAVLSGFTLTGGATRAADPYGNSVRSQTSGAGVWCPTGGAFVTNCVLSKNAAAEYGGGAFGVSLDNCTLTTNSAGIAGGGISYGTLRNCVLAGNSSSAGGGGAASASLSGCTLTGNSSGNGGGAESSSLKSCRLKGNRAYWQGGGASSSTLDNCTFVSNWCGGYGGGAYSSPANNCLFSGNSADTGGGAADSDLNNCTLARNSAGTGGGACNGNFNNCILYYNTSTNGGNYAVLWSSISFNYSCTTPMPTNGVGNIATVPQFVDYAHGNLRLQSNSPCINTGNNAFVTGTTDCDGRPRILGQTVDMGAYEYQGPEMGEFLGWLEQYGVATDGSADYADSDSDGLNNWQEWCCRTVPTNAASVLRMLSAIPAGTNVLASWQSVPGVAYYLLRSTNLYVWPQFQLLATNLVAQAGTTTFIDTNASRLSPLYYRVGVGTYFAPISPPPPTLTWQFSRSTRTLELSWTGAGFHLQAQTNSPGAGIGASWFDCPGGANSPVTVPVEPLGGAVFYQLAWPQGP